MAIRICPDVLCSMFRNIGYWCCVLLMFTPIMIHAIELGAGSLDVNLTTSAVLDNNVHYAKENPEEAVQAQMTPGISYTLPFGFHRLSLGYQGTVVASDQEQTNSLRHSPFGSLIFQFPGGLESEFSDRFTHIQDKRKEEYEEIDGPDYVVNQGEFTGRFVRSGFSYFDVFYRNTIYRYESRAEYRNSDGHAAGGKIAVPMSYNVGLLLAGDWEIEELDDMPIRSYVIYQAAGGLRFEGPARFHLEVLGGFQSYDYYDDPSEDCYQ